MERPTNDSISPKVATWGNMFIRKFASIICISAQPLDPDIRKELPALSNFNREPGNLIKANEACWLPKDEGVGPARDLNNFKLPSAKILLQSPSSIFSYQQRKKQKTRLKLKENQTQNAIANKWVLRVGGAKNKFQIKYYQVGHVAGMHVLLNSECPAIRELNTNNNNKHGKVTVQGHWPLAALYLRCILSNIVIWSESEKVGVIRIARHVYSPASAWLTFVI